MRKKFVSLLMAGALTAGMLTGCSSGGGSGSGSEGESASSDGDYDLTLYSINTTDPEFDDWLANVEEAKALVLQQASNIKGANEYNIFTQKEV